MCVVSSAAISRVNGASPFPRGHAFTERLPNVVAPYARKTQRLVNQQTQLAYVLGGEAGAFILMLLGMPTSADTLLNPRVRESLPSKSVIGGQALETHQPVDLLLERSAVSLEAWLKSHPGVEIISRDRGKEYIKGASDGAPDALQVAGRWHLLHNLRESVEAFLGSRPVCLAAAEVPESTPALDTPSHSSLEPGEETTLGQVTAVTESPKLTKAQRLKQSRDARRQECYDAVHELNAQGVSKRGIARQLNLSSRTVSKYLEAESYPTYPEGVRRGTSILQPHMDYLQKRWQEGCHNASQLWRELQQQGYPGARGLVARWAAKRCEALRSQHNPEGLAGDAIAPEALTKPIAPWSPSRAAWLFVRKPEDLEQEDQEALDRMLETSESVKTAYTLAQRFGTMVRERDVAAFESWLEDIVNSGIKVLKSFANGLKQDFDAVKNALSLPWSNGQTEGQITRLKLIKRCMYGRANFDLLRKRVLAHPIRG